MKKIVILLLLGILFISGYFSLAYLSRPDFHPATYKAQNVDNKKPRILITHIACKEMRGGEMHTFQLYKTLREKGYPVSLLIRSDTELGRALKQAGLPYYSTSSSFLGNYLRPLYQYVLAGCIKSICQIEHIQLVHCQNYPEIKSTRWATKNMPVKIVLTRHTEPPFSIHNVKGIDGAIGVGKHVAAYLMQENIKQKLGIKNIRYIPSIFRMDQFLSYVPDSNSNRDFFAKTFNITLSNNPIVCSIGNMAFNFEHKNFPLLLKAVAYLIHEKNTPIQLVIAGDGPARKIFEKMAHDLKISSDVHFLGWVHQTPALLYHCDMFVLASSKEALGLVYLEAGIMKKPAIGAYGTGAESIIIHKQTGLLFKNSDYQDLARTIKILVENPEFAEELGNNAYTHVQSNFDPISITQQHEALYSSILGNHV